MNGAGHVTKVTIVIIELIIKHSFFYEPQSPFRVPNKMLLTCELQLQSYMIPSATPKDRILPANELSNLSVMFIFKYLNTLSCVRQIKVYMNFSFRYPIGRNISKNVVNHERVSDT